MILHDLQRLLTGIYDLQFAHDVYDFLVTDRHSLRNSTVADPGGRVAEPLLDEQLLVVCDDTAVGMSLFIDRAVLQRLEGADPTAALNGANLADYWTALEGVSHFLYLGWNAAHDKPVSLLELELQAEVDKYVTSFWLLRAQDPLRFPRELHRALFERARVDLRLAADRAGLYVTANRYAARFCRRIERRLQGDVSVDSVRQLVAELRRFYRLTNLRKLTHIERYA